MTCRRTHVTAWARNSQPCVIKASALTTVLWLSFSCLHNYIHNYESFQDFIIPHFADVVHYNKYNFKTCFYCFDLLVLVYGRMWFSMFRIRHILINIFIYMYQDWYSLNVVHDKTCFYHFNLPSVLWLNCIWFTIKHVLIRLYLLSNWIMITFVLL